MFLSTVNDSISLAKLISFSYFKNILLFLMTFSSISLAHPVTGVDSFDAHDVPISEFIDWVSHQTGENIIVGRGVSGSISVHVNKLDSSGVISLFINVMKANGYVVDLDNSGFYKILVDANNSLSDIDIITKLYTFKNISNSKVVPVISSYLSSTKKLNISSSENDNKNNKTDIVNIVTLLPSSNSILVSGTVDQISVLDSLIPKIDVAAKQVVVNAVIVENDLGVNKSVGVNFSTALSKNGFTAVTSASGIPSLTGLVSGGNVVYSKGGNIRGLINALEKNTDTKILSTPNILVMDREQGFISVGQNVPFLVSSEVTDGGSVVQQIERKDVGVSLYVTPHIIDDDHIIMNIRQTSSSVTDSTQASDIITNNRTISTVATFQDGQTIALGGLVSDEKKHVVSGIPWLKDIPFIGFLFRTTSTETIQRQLTVMIKVIVLS